MALPKTSKLIGFVASTDAQRSRDFYQGKLGLQLISEDSFALVFDVNGTMLRVTMAREVVPAQYTVLGWEVSDMKAAVADLVGGGVEMERYAFIQQDEAGIWTAPGGAQVAWFRDPDGNLLSLSTHA